MINKGAERKSPAPQRENRKGTVINLLRNPLDFHEEYCEQKDALITISASVSSGAAAT